MFELFGQRLWSVFGQRLWRMLKHRRTARSELGIGSGHRGTQIVVDGLLDFHFLGNWNEASDKAKEQPRVVLGDVFQIPISVVHVIEDAQDGFLHGLGLHGDRASLFAATFRAPFGPSSWVCDVHLCHALQYIIIC
ncbi:MAG: hypothetical protein HOK11_03270 [Rhodospirillaceae bacterium]|jgi:hypothetical protein|nr:hypothetical protein [Rhodospirillaceae bacterium]